MRIFVTGATGFVGSHVVRALQARGDDVVMLARSPKKVERVFGPGAPDTVHGTLTDQDALRTGCRGADAVIHIAGVVAARSDREFHTVNSDATANLVRVARETAPNLERFLYVSSLSAVGPSSAGEPIDEQREPRPISEYGRSKLAGERATRDGGLPWTIVRPAAVYGPRDIEFLKVFKLAKIGIAPVFAGGTQELSLIHGADLGGAIVSGLHPNAAGKAYFASHPEIWTQRQLGEVIYRAVRQRNHGSPFTFSIPGIVARAALGSIGVLARAAGQATLLTRDKVGEFLAAAWTCRSDALQRDTEWRPVTGLEHGTRESATWYRDNGWL